MKRVSHSIALIFIASLTNITMPFPQLSLSRLTQLKHSLSRQLNTFYQCLKGDIACDRERVKLYRTITTILALFATSSAGYYFEKYYLPTRYTPTSSPTPEKFDEKKSLEPQALINEELREAVRSNNYATASTLITHGAKVVQEKPEQSLLFVVKDPNMLRLLLYAGATVEINNRNDTHETPLIVAVKDATIESRFVEELLEVQGIDVEAKDNTGKEALQYAQERFDIATTNKINSQKMKWGKVIAMIEAKRNKK
jgi:hypothetical protein